MENISNEMLDIVQKNYRRYPTLFAYLYYDLLYEPYVTKVNITTDGENIKGYVLTYWRPRNCPAVHIVGDVDYVKLPDTNCMRIHLESGAKIDIPKNAKKELAMSMVCDSQCVENAKRIISTKEWEVKSVRPEDYYPTSPLIDVKHLFSRCKVYGVYVGDRLASRASVCVSLPEVWVISDVYTHPEYRGRGMATYLTAYVTSLANDAGATPILSVLESNTPAVKAYRKIGYRAERTFWLIIIQK